MSHSRPSASTALRALAAAAAVAVLLSGAPPAGAQVVTGPGPSARQGDSASEPAARPSSRQRRRARPAPRRTGRAPTRRGPTGADARGRAHDERLGRDAFRTLGGTSPFCQRGGLGRTERENCRRSGSIGLPTQVDHLQFDTNVDTGVTKIGGNFNWVLQFLVNLVWLGLLWVLKGVMLVLEWAFSLDLLDDSMRGLRPILDRLHNDVLGQAWFSVAIAVAGLAAIYTGFVQRRVIQTAAGLGATVLLMVAGLVVINDPRGTVGYAGQLTNDAALSLLAGTTSGDFEQPARGYGQAMTRAFHLSARQPFCALQFSEMDFCLAKPSKVIAEADLPSERPEIKAAWRESRSVADMFARFPANGESDDDKRNQRRKLYEAFEKKEGSRLAAVVRIQEEGGTAQRLALLVVIAIGLVGQILLFAWLAVRLLGYAVLSLVLLLFSPIAFLAPAFGESGRATFLAWAKRLAGAIVAKAIYAAFLAVTLVTTALLSKLGLAWLPLWLLLAVLWWALFLKRDELLEVIDLSKRAGFDARGQRSSIERALLSSQIKRKVAGGAAAGVGAVAGAPKRRASAALATRKQGRRRAAEGHAQKRLGDSAERVQGGRIAAARQALEAGKATGAQRELVAQADRNTARHGREVAPEERKGLVARRKAELSAGKIKPDDPKALAAAGISPRSYRQAQPKQQAEMRERAADKLREERKLAGALPSERGKPAPAKDVRQAAKGAPPGAVRSERRQLRREQRGERDQTRQERRLARARGGLRRGGVRPPSRGGRR